MNEKELKSIESELEKRGYRKWTVALAGHEDHGWLKTLGEEDNDYQIEFRVWDYTKFEFGNIKPYSLDVWASPKDESTAKMTISWHDVADIDTFEQMAAEFNQMVRKYVNPEKEER